ncbi:MAG: hypothetical protein HQK96_08520 [Nitrospirae bacterium]|nr:hypothetical protein [Nitrospirota bacterium]
MGELDTDERTYSVVSYASLARKGCKMEHLKKQYSKVFGFVLLIVLFIGSWIYYAESKPSVNQTIPDSNSALDKSQGIVPEKGITSHQKTEKRAQVQTGSNNMQTSGSMAPLELGSDFTTNIDKIKILSKYGTPEQKDTIASYAADTNKEIAIRLAAVEDMDWEKYREPLVNIIRSNDEVVAATIYIASAKELSEETRRLVDEAVYSTFQTTSPNTQIAILNYFLEQHSDLFDTLYTQLYNKNSFDGYSEGEKDNVLQLLKQRRQDQDISGETHI